MNIEKRQTTVGTVFRSRFMVNYTSFNSPWLPTREQAKNWAAEKRAEVLAGVVNTGSVMTLKEFTAHWLARHAYVRKVYSAALRDQQMMEGHVLPVLGAKKLRSITAEQIELLVSNLHRQGKLKPKTINNILGCLKKILSDAVRWRHIGFNPAKEIEPLKISQQEVTYFHHDEVTRLLVFSREHYPAEYELIVFALNTGCRLGECIGLIWPKVDLDREVALIDSIWEEKLKRIAPRTKGKKIRQAPLNEACLTILKHMHLQGRQSEALQVFGRVSYHAVTHQKFKRILRRAGLQKAIDRGANFHSLRHTFASEFMRSGGRLSDLQLILGHQSMKQTEKYLHFAPDYLAGATKRVSFAAPEGQLLQISRKQKA